MKKRVGSLVFATHQGLGILARDFVRNGVVTHVTMIAHSKRKNHEEWYPGSKICWDLRGGLDDLKAFCRSVDIMFFFETPFVWELIDYCRTIKVKTLLMPMYECMPRTLPATPDAFVNPSSLDQQYYPRGTHIPVPVEVPWRKRDKATEFLHNAGNGGLNGRNGTRELLDAVKYVKSKAKIIIRSQDPQMPVLPPNVEYRVQDIAFEDLWRRGGECDVLVFPEKFNGLSLPLQEARAAGMLVMGTDRFPMNEWLPRAPLIPVKTYTESCVSHRCNPFKEAVIDPKDIAAKIDEFYGADISAYSEEGREYADRMSWARLKPRYMELLESL